MAKVIVAPKNFTPRDWSMLKDYCHGVRCREIEDKYDCYQGRIKYLAESVGIARRPTGFASYTIAHNWVCYAKVEYELAKARYYE
jgi:hypothetical protein